MVVHPTHLAAVARTAFDTEQARLALHLASQQIAPLFPLGSFVAAAPLLGFEHLPFEQACREAGRLFGARTHLPLARWRERLAAGEVDAALLDRALAVRLGGPTEAFAMVAPELTAFDIARRRLVTPLPQAADPGLVAAALTLLGKARAAVRDRVAAAEPAPVSAIDRLPTASRAAADAFVAKWCAAFFAGETAAVPLPGRQRGLWPAVQALAAHDADLAALAGEGAGARLLAMPADPLAAVAEGVRALGAEDDAVALLARLLARLPGYAGHLRWRADFSAGDVPADTPADFADLAALWIALERLVAPRAALAAGPDPDAPARAAAGRIAAALASFGVDAGAIAAVPVEAVDAAVLAAALPEAELAAVFLDAAEEGYRSRLLSQLAGSAAGLSERHATARPDAQLVFCIDVRSEPFRRALEAAGAYETFGYAGFFGVPMALQAADGARRKQLPVLLQPSHEVLEAPAAPELAERVVRARQRGEAAGGVFARLKAGLATAFATAEAVGPLAGAGMVARTLAPRGVDRLARRIGGRHAAAEAFRPRPAFSCDAGGPTGLTLDEQVAHARALFALTGFPPVTARLVVLAGHGGSTVNNAYAAALHCGACGGHPGGANARLMAAILNDPAVRARLAAEGRLVAGDTWFVAGEHDTTTDAVALFDRSLVPASHAGDLARLEAALARAGDANRRRRAVALGTTPEDLLARAADWSEVRPEWGLARNAAFVVGPRALTEAHDLGGRVFLHSYDWRQDGEGKALATVLTAPMVVAEWINTQYLFSTVDNERLGAGDKTTQTVLGGFAVMQGNGGDLCVGLPRQSVLDDAGRPYHEPLRLMTVVHAPRSRVEAVIAAHEVLKRLFGNGWVALAVLDPEDGGAWRLGPGLVFTRDDAASASDETLEMAGRAG